MSLATFDRFLFAFTVGSHIIFVSMSISIILMVFLAEILYFFKKNPEYRDLVLRLRKIFVISFGIGTASGIVLAVELVALFPKFMTIVSETGAINLFYAEIFAFFLETIALVVYIYFEGVYKWKYTNITLSFVILFGTLLSAVFITMVNAWMNTPNGFNLTAFITTGKVTGVNAFAPFITPSTFSEVAHVLVTTVFAGVMVLGAYFSYKYIRVKDATMRNLYATMIRMTSIVSIVTIVLAGITGSNEMATILKLQPLKYAAADLNYYPGTNLPEKIFGTIVNGHVVGAITIPGLQSFLATFETGIKYLPGLTQFPSSEWPPLVIHTTFDIMVVGGLILGLFLFISFLVWVVKKDVMKYKGILYVQIIAGIFAFIVYELGWVTDEVGRQPWIIYNVMTVSQAASNSSGLLIPGYFIIAFYLVVIPSTFYFFDRIFNSSPAKDLKKEINPISSAGGGQH
ncbi:MAG: cytochrome ubiquinol oxidase subunit I [Thermoplasmatales archaeon]